MVGQVGDGAKEVKTLKALKEFFFEDDITVVGFFDSKDDSKFALYKDEGKGFQLLGTFK